MENYEGVVDNVFDDLLGPSNQTVDEAPPDTGEDTSMDLDFTGEEKNEHSTEEQKETHETSSYMDQFLSNYGIQDGVITYENDNGETEEVKFDELDNDEKLAILKNLTSPGLTEEEVKVVNYLRSNNKSFSDVIRAYQEQAVQEYIKANGEPTKSYTIDDYTDDELYIADLKIKFPDMTDEDIEIDLENAKMNEGLYKKKVDTIRTQYKAREDDEIKSAEQARLDQYNKFTESIDTALNNFKEISLDYTDAKSDKMEIEDREKEAVYRYILEQDKDGLTQIYKDLSDPQKLVKFAWFALYGDSAISDITSYWKQQLKTTRRQKQASPAQTVVKPKENKTKDDFFPHRHSVEIELGENLL